MIRVLFYSNNFISIKIKLVYRNLANEITLFSLTQQCRGILYFRWVSLTQHCDEFIFLLSFIWIYLYDHEDDLFSITVTVKCGNWKNNALVFTVFVKTLLHIIYNEPIVVSPTVQTYFIFSLIDLFRDLDHLFSILNITVECGNWKNNAGVFSVFVDDFFWYVSICYSNKFFSIFLLK